MHILGPDQRRPRKDRSTAEKAFQRLNTIVVAVQLACLLIVVAQITMNSGKTFNSNFFGVSEYQVLDPALLNTTCVLESVTSGSQFTDYKLVLSYKNIPWMLSKNVNDVRTCIAANSVLIVLGAINKLFFDFNAHEFRYHHFVFRKEVLTVWEMLALIVSYVTTKSIERNASIISRYLIACGNNNGNAYVSNIPFVPIFISLAIVTFVHFVSILIALKNMLRRHPKDDMVREVDEFGEDVESEGPEAANFEFEPEVGIEPQGTRVEEGRPSP
jgi:hypothetical protein